MTSYSIVQKNKARGNLAWYGKSNEDGKLSFVSLKTKKRSEALEWLSMMNAQRFIPEQMRTQKKDHSFNDSIRQFLVMVETSKGPSNTLVAYTNRLEHLKKWATERNILMLRQFTAQEAGMFSAKIATRYAPKTANEIIKLSTSFFSWCEDTFELGGLRPFRTVKRPKIVKTMKAFWTVPQIEAILAEAPTPEIRAFWGLMAFAGLRYSEALTLKWENLHEEHIHLIGKGGKVASIPISSRLSKILYLLDQKKEGPLFEDELSRHNYESIRSLKEAVKKSGIEFEGTVDNHRFRHSFASNLIRSGVNIKAVQQLMRHESITITLDTYSHLLPTDLTDAVEL